MTDPTPTDQIGALPDEQAVTVLALVLKRQGHTVDPFTWPQTEAHLREALNQPEVTARATLIRTPAPARWPAPLSPSWPKPTRR